MKRCPLCKKNYYDETLEFCLEDGSRLNQIDGRNNEILTADSIRPNIKITQAETVQYHQTPELHKSNLRETKLELNPGISAKKEIIKQNVAQTSRKFLEISPIILALTHNYWQWLYLSKQPTYQLSTFLSSYNFLVWLFLLLNSFIFGVFSLKYSKNKGFAITALVVLAINVILSIVPK